MRNAPHVRGIDALAQCSILRDPHVTPAREPTSTATIGVRFVVRSSESMSFAPSPRCTAPHRNAEIALLVAMHLLAGCGLVGFDPYSPADASDGAAVPAPTVAFSSPAEGTSVADAAASAFTVSGTCSANGQSVIVSGARSGTSSCVSGTWTITLDVSAITSGSFRLDVTQADALGNVAAPTSRTFFRSGAATTSCTAGACDTSCGSASHCSFACTDSASCGGGSTVTCGAFCSAQCGPQIVNCNATCGEGCTYACDGPGSSCNASVGANSTVFCRTRDTCNLHLAVGAAVVCEASSNCVLDSGCTGDCNVRCATVGSCTGVVGTNSTVECATVSNCALTVGAGSVVRCDATTSTCNVSCVGACTVDFVGAHNVSCSAGSPMCTATRCTCL